MSTIDIEVHPRPDTAADVFARAAALVPALRERARYTEELRQIPDETMAELYDSGLFLLASPLSMGGWGYGIEEFGNVVRILARGCPSTAWVYSFMVIHFVQMILELPEQAQEEIHGGQPFATSANSSGFQAMGSGTATPAPGGWRVSGRFPFASGAMNSDWVFLTTLEDTSEGPKPLMAIVPMADLEIEDVWHVQGLRGTGSNTLVARDIFIPSYRRANITPTVEERAAHVAKFPHADSPLATFSALRTFDVVLPAVPLGAAEGALEVFRERIKTREIAFHNGSQRDHPEAWVRYSDAHVTVQSARLLWDESVRVCAALAAAGQRTGTHEQNAELRLRTAKVGLLSRDAVSIMIDGAGSSIHHLDHPLQRFQRDINVAKNHSYTHWDESATTAGQVLLGLEGPVHYLIDK
ncbi:MAG: Acyl-CoA dehydrogenase [Frankiales bacterium]|nr:Acyl-CoA dehydrogenase [Frankiales bacterium]